MLSFRFFQFQNQREGHVMLPPAFTHGEREIGIKQIEIDSRAPGLLGILPGGLSGLTSILVLTGLSSIR
jgi:hypothetical protein